MKSGDEFGPITAGHVGRGRLEWVGYATRCQDIKVIATVDATPVESIRIGLYEDCYATSIQSHFSTCFSLPTGRWSGFGYGDTIKRGSGWLAGIGE